MAFKGVNKAVMACVVSLMFGAGSARAQSEGSAEMSLLPLASVAGAVAVVGASATAGVMAVSALPIALSVTGAVLVVKAVEVSARGTVYVLERASDGARVSVAVSAQAAQASALAVGSAVEVGLLTAGVVLSAAGKVLAFIPNEVGQALVHNERVAF